MNDSAPRKLEPGKKGLLTLAAALALASPARAQEAVQAAPPPSKEVCGKSYVDGQHLRADRKLMAARSAFAVCALDACPQAVRPDCAQWLADVTREIPTIAVHAQDAHGVDVADVRVSVDGVVVADKLVGLPIELDPGPRMLRFERADAAPVVQRVVAVQGEKLRSIDIHFTAAEAPVVAPPLATSSRPIPVATWALGGAGVAAGAVTAILWASAESQYSGLKASCAPRCNPSQADSARTEMVAGDVTLGVGIAALAGAAIFYFLRPSVPAESSGGAAGFFVTVSPRGAALGTRFSF